uniref:ATP-binding cassette domain-containing protein n=1 Tax=Desulfacinum infernum TaxID=35837 RepID=A0A832EDF9_9BACT
MELVFLTARNRQATSAKFPDNGTILVGSRQAFSLPGEGILPEHARLIREQDEFYIEPLSGAPVTLNGKRLVGRCLLQDGDWVSLGKSAFQVKIGPLAVDPDPANETQHNRAQGPGRISIGRLPESDLYIPSPLVSRRHAEVIWSNGRAFLRDLNSTNGTFINGERVTGTRILRAGDTLQIGTFFYVFKDHRLEPLDTLGLIRIEAHGLGTEVRDRAGGRFKRLLDNVDLVVEPGEFVVIFGSSGSGKSTLLDALSGRRPAGHGRLFYNGVDFYSCISLFRKNIGYVPQQDTVHRKIKVQRALQYAARLRLPTDTGLDEMDMHIQRVLERLGLGEKAQCAIDTPSPLSGGQMKRVCLAAELIANPNVLFLDEVTSGLDAGTDKKMMQLFAELASEKKTVICVTHTLENVSLCHLVLLVHQGKVIYFGPPEETLAYFGVSRLSEVYETIENQSAASMAERYSKSEFYDQFILRRYTTRKEPEPLQQPTLQVRSQPTRIKDSLFQFWTLVQRYVDLLLADRRNSLILLAQAPIIALMIGLVFHISGTPDKKLLAESQVSFMLVLSAIWCGCLNSTREIVKELPIYLRERTVGLGIGPYLISKFLPLAALCIIQCAMMLSIVTFLSAWSGPFWSRLMVLVATAVASTAMGLAISTVVNSSDKAVALVPVLLIPQVIFSNFVVSLDGVEKTLARTLVFAFPAFDAMKNLSSDEVRPLMHVEGSLAQNIATIGLLGLGFLALAVGSLKWKDRKRG